MTGMALTDAGKNLLIQAQNGAILKITKIALGDGILTDGELGTTLTNLKNEIITLDIQDLSVYNGQSRIRALLNNTNLKSGFYVREIGVFAKIGDNGSETLYSYLNDGINTDYIPDVTVKNVEELLEIYITIGNAQNVTCTINNSVTLATKEDVNTLIIFSDNEPINFSINTYWFKNCGSPPNFDFGDAMVLGNAITSTNAPAENYKYWFSEN